MLADRMHAPLFTHKTRTVSVRTFACSRYAAENLMDAVHLRASSRGREPALNQAFRGIWIEQALDHGQVREYWDEGDIDELEMLALDASTAVERAWRALSDVVDAHAAQCEAEFEAGEDD